MRLRLTEIEAPPRPQVSGGQPGSTGDGRVRQRTARVHLVQQERLKGRVCNTIKHGRGNCTGDVYDNIMNNIVKMPIHRNRRDRNCCCSSCGVMRGSVARIERLGHRFVDQ